MKHFRILTRVLALLALLYLVAPPKAYAYLDPGAGSYLLQLAIGALVGTAFAVKIFWKQIRTFLSNLFSRSKGDEETED